VLNVQRDNDGLSVVFEIAAIAAAWFDVVIGTKSSASVLALVSLQPSSPNTRSAGNAMWFI
jgi:hypothetical protein